MKITSFAKITFAALLCASAAYAAEDEGRESAHDNPALAVAMKQATVSLAAGLRASEAQGTPISAKFELEDGKLQLSIYTLKDGQFSEVIVDHKTGKIAKSAPITGGEDLTAARHQAAALAKARHSLRQAVAAAEQANAGYKAVSAEAEVEDGAAQADVSLLNGAQFKHVDQQL